MLSEIENNENNSINHQIIKYGARTTSNFHE